MNDIGKGDNSISLLLIIWKIFIRFKFIYVVLFISKDKAVRTVARQQSM